MRGDDADRHPSAEEQACRSARNLASRPMAAHVPRRRQRTSPAGRGRPRVGGVSPPGARPDRLLSCWSLLRVGCCRGGAPTPRLSARAPCCCATRCSACGDLVHMLEPLRGGPSIQSSLIRAQTAPLPCKLRTQCRRPSRNRHLRPDGANGNRALPPSPWETLQKELIGHDRTDPAQRRVAADRHRPA